MNKLDYEKKPLITQKPELLSPAGDVECVFAAVENGASSVYAGAGNYNARRGAKNLTISELERAVDYCHVRGVKMYVTANTLIKDSEADRFLDFVESVYLIGADGVILQDVGCASLIKRRFPDFYLSASTQMSVCDAAGVNFLHNNGFDRVILARELSVSEVSDISRDTEAEIECFVHGAICVSYSGQCLMSAFNGGRSGNRGFCAQPCRLSYGLYNNDKLLAEGNILSPKDMTGLYALPELIKAGVCSLKIEGRMKSPEYVAGAVAIYRKYIDAFYENPDSYEVDERDIFTLESLFCRGGGLSKGYFHVYSGKGMLTEGKPGNAGVVIGSVSSVKGGTVEFTALHDVTAGDGVEIGGRGVGAYLTQNARAGSVARVNIGGKAGDSGVIKGDSVFRTYDKALFDRLQTSNSKNQSQIEITGRFTARLGENMRLCVRYGEIEASAVGAAPEKAQTVAVVPDEVVRRLTKTGGTPFAFISIETELDNDLFINIRELNELRRTALSALEKKITESHKRSKPSVIAGHLTEPNSINDIEHSSGGFTVLVRSREQLQAAGSYDFKRLYVDLPVDERDIAPFKDKGIEVFRCFPRMERRHTLSVKNKQESLLYDGCLIRTYGQFSYVSQYDCFATDYTLNASNCLSMEFWKRYGSKSVCLSPELSLSEIDGISPRGTEIVCYGRITLMTTVQCPVGNFGGDRLCRGRHGRLKLAGGKEYVLLPDCEHCQCLILDSEPVDINLEVCKHNRHQRLNRIEFSDESFVDAKYIMSTIIGKSDDGSENAGIKTRYAGRYIGGVK